MLPSPLQSLRDLKTYDETRDSLPGEHWLMAAAALAVLYAASRSDTTFKRSLGTALGSAMLYRAASGRDGVAKLLKYLPNERGVIR